MEKPVGPHVYMFPALSMSINGSASSRCASAGTAAENWRPCAGAEGNEASSAVVVTTSFPSYGWPVGATLLKPQAITSYWPDVRLSAVTVSVVEPPSLDPT